MPLKIVFLEAPKLVSTKTLLLKHYYRRQGTIRAIIPEVLTIEFLPPICLAIVYAILPIM